MQIQSIEPPVPRQEPASLPGNSADMGLNSAHFYWIVIPFMFDRSIHVSLGKARLAPTMDDSFLHDWYKNGDFPVYGRNSGSWKVYKCCGGEKTDRRNINNLKINRKNI